MCAYREPGRLTMAAIAEQSRLRKAVGSLANWLTGGPDPKVRDPENSSRRVGNASGVTVNDASAMRLSAFWACTRLISSTIGSLPMGVYTTDRDGTQVVARDAPLYTVLHDSPNADQTPVDYFEYLTISMLLRGDHFARKLMIDNRLIGLEPVNPAIVTVTRQSTGRLRYTWSADGKSYDLDEDGVFHIRGFGGGPMHGLSVISYAAESLGIAIAADRAAGGMFGNGIMPSGVFESDMKLDRAQQELTENLLYEKYRGAMKAGTPMVLGHGLKWQSISMNADDMQLLESRGWSVEEICRWFGIPPFMIGHNEKTTSWGTGIEQMLLGFQKFTLNPYLRRIEQAVRKQLISPADRAKGLFAEFNLEGLLRADSQGRATFYESALRNKWMVINEVRAKEPGLGPVAWGNEPIVQAQDTPLSERLAEIAKEVGNAS